MFYFGGAFMSLHFTPTEFKREEGAVYKLFNPNGFLILLF